MLDMFKLIKDIKSKAGIQHFKRWNILSTPWFRIYLHEISRADEDFHLHSHPWHFISLILKGGYSEKWISERESKHIMPYKMKYELISHHRWNILFRKAGDFHKIIDIKPSTKTLVFTFGKKRPWGFYVDGKVISNDEYRKMKN